MVISNSELLETPSAQIRINQEEYSRRKRIQELNNTLRKLYKNKIFAIG